MTRSTRDRSSHLPRRVSIWFLALSNLLVFQLTLVSRSNRFHSHFSPTSLDTTWRPPSFRNDTRYHETAYPLNIPQGVALALPSIPVSEELQKTYFRKQYGGEGDKPHLGGFLSNGVDMMGVSPTIWKYMVEELGIKSILDVGCGRGISTSWFHLHGLEAHCVEGSHDAIQQSLLTPQSLSWVAQKNLGQTSTGLPSLVEHDFSRGPWWPEKTVDAIWCVEFLEHVGRYHHANLLPTFRKAALIFATHSMWGGWHHVEVHDSDWWITKFQSYGFVYSPHLTTTVRDLATDEAHFSQSRRKGNETFYRYRAQHLFLHLMVSLLQLNFEVVNLLNSLPLNGWLTEFYCRCLSIR